MTVDPQATEPRLNCLRFLMDEEKFTEAVPLAKETLALLPGNVEVLGLLAGALQMQQKFAEALPYRLQALATNPLDQSLLITAAMAVEAPRARR